MPQQQTDEAVRHTVMIEAPIERAFTLFTDELDTWWPPEYTWAGEVLDTIGIEPCEGGRCFERGPHGFTCDWGHVLAWEAPRRLVFSWQISPTRVPVPDPEQASEVEVRFVDEGSAKTRVELEHRAFACHGESAEAYRVAMGSQQGWPYILGRYAEAAAHPDDEEIT